MSNSPETQKIIATIICPKCGNNTLQIYNRAKYRCGSCSSGGLIVAKKFRFIMENKEIMLKIDKEIRELYPKTKVCDKCQAIVWPDDKECPYCVRKV